MKKWLLAFASLLVIAGATYAVRWQGVDLVQLAGFGPATSSTPPADNQKKPLAAAARNRGPAPVEIAAATMRQLSDDIAAIGTLLAEESVTIAPETSGRLANILFTDGQVVAEGTPLFQLDADLANAALLEAGSRLSLAEANFKRNQTLRKSGNVATATFDASATELEVAKSAVESAKVNLNKLTIAAPFAGTLGFRSVSAGAYVTAGSELVQLDMVQLLKVSFSIPELQQARIAVGQSVAVLIDAVPGETFSAMVTGIAPNVDVNGRSLQIRAAIDNAARKLRPGMLARVIVKGPSRDAITVPEAAIVQRSTDAFVFVIDGTSAREVKVNIGQRSAGLIEVIDGIAQGANVVVAGASGIRNGAEVEVVKGPTAVE